MTFWITAQTAISFLCTISVVRFVQNPYNCFGVPLSVGLVHVYSFEAANAALRWLA